MDWRQRGRQSAVDGLQPAAESRSLADALIVLRAYRPEDFDAIVALDRDCFEPGIAYSDFEMRRFLSLTTRVAAVAERQSSLAGFCIGYRSPSRSGRILTIDVGATHRRFGVGRALLEHVVAKLIAAGARETVLEVDAANPSAIAFYERLAFHKAGTIADYYGPNRTALEMRRKEPSTISTS